MRLIPIRPHAHFGQQRHLQLSHAGHQARNRFARPACFGRRLWLPEINSPNGPRRAGSERAAINAPMQGTAADLIKLAMIAVQRALDGEQRATRMVMQVHDELVLEVPAAEAGWAREADRKSVG